MRTVVRPDGIETEVPDMRSQANPNSPLNRRSFLSLATASAAGLAAVRPLSASILSQGSEFPAGARAGDWPMFGQGIRGTRGNPHETIIGRHNVAHTDQDVTPIDVNTYKISRV